MAYQEQQTQRRAVGGWSRARWLLLAVVVIAIAARLMNALRIAASGNIIRWTRTKLRTVSAEHPTPVRMTAALSRDIAEINTTPT